MLKHGTSKRFKGSIWVLLGIKEGSTLLGFGYWPRRLFGWELYPGARGRILPFIKFCSLVLGPESVVCTRNGMHLEWPSEGAVAGQNLASVANQE